jgi:hypothetical protein
MFSCRCTLTRGDQRNGVVLTRHNELLQWADCDLLSTLHYYQIDKSTALVINAKGRQEKRGATGGGVDDGERMSLSFLVIFLIVIINHDSRHFWFLLPTHQPRALLAYSMHQRFMACFWVHGARLVMNQKQSNAGISSTYPVLE